MGAVVMKKIAMARHEFPRRYEGRIRSFFLAFQGSVLLRNMSSHIS